MLKFLIPIFICTGFILSAQQITESKIPLEGAEVYYDTEDMHLFIKYRKHVYRINELVHSCQCECDEWD
jgi:hypothetical protein